MLKKHFETKVTYSYLCKPFPALKSLKYGVYFVAFRKEGGLDDFGIAG